MFKKKHKTPSREKTTPKKQKTRRYKQPGNSRLWQAAGFKSKKTKWKKVRVKCCLVVSDSLWPHALHSPWNSPGQNSGVGSLSLLQGVFPTQGLNPGLPNCRQILYQLSHKGRSRILVWVAFFSGSSQLLRTQIRSPSLASLFVFGITDKALSFSSKIIEL